MNSKKILAAVLSAFVLFSTGCGGKIKTGKVMEEEQPYAYTVSQVGDTVMPIMSYIAPMGEVTVDGQKFPSSITDGVYSKMNELGINLMDGVGFYGNEEWAQANLEMCDKYGFGALISAGAWWSTFYQRYVADGKITPFAEMIETQQNYIKNIFFNSFEKYMSHKSFAGINYTDEMGIAAAQSIGDATRLLKEKYPDKLCLNNCIGSGASIPLMQYNGFNGNENGLELTTSEIAQKIATESWRWGTYVDHYMKTAEPQVFSYDDYPWRKGTSKIVPRFMRELETAATYCSQYKVPFWNFIQTGMWHAPGSDNCRTPSYSELAYQINASLAFGAQGLECFLISPVGDSGEYSSATLTGEAKFIFDLNGNTTDLYEPLKKVFDNVKSIDEILMKSVWKGVMETESLELKMNAIQTISEGYALKDFNQVTSLTSDNAYAVAGCFNYGGYTALYVMNANTDKIMSDNSEITVNFNQKVKGYTLFVGKKSEFTGGSFTIKNIAPGEAALIVID